jgi:hypothetical protein
VKGQDVLCRCHGSNEAASSGNVATGLIPCDMIECFSLYLCSSLSLDVIVATTINSGILLRFVQLTLDYTEIDN